jgi:hypothetical protein
MDGRDGEALPLPLPTGATPNESPTDYVNEHNAPVASTPFVTTQWLEDWTGTHESRTEGKLLQELVSVASVQTQEVDPSSRQRGRPTERSQQISDRINMWSRVPQWARHQDRQT